MVVRTCQILEGVPSGRRRHEVLSLVGEKAGDVPPLLHRVSSLLDRFGNVYVRFAFVAGHSQLLSATLNRLQRFQVDTAFLCTTWCATSVNEFAALFRVDSKFPARLEEWLAKFPPENPIRNIFRCSAKRAADYIDQKMGDAKGCCS